jgi:hypothetical protein
MHRVLLGFAALAATGAFGASLSTAADGREFFGTARTQVGQFGSGPNFGDLCRSFRRDRDGDRRRGRDRCRGDVVMDWYGGEWALYNNRSWEPDSYNDWWHDRPDRAYPRWVQHNRDCTADRMWWSGQGWHC